MTEKKMMRMKRRKKMKMSDQYIDEILNRAQKLLWGGSETENIEAHNLISKLIKDRVEQVSN
jgi:DNA topoisomerase VI subunit B